MFEFSLNLTDPSKDSYYLPIILSIATIFLIIQLIIMLLKELRRESGGDINISINKTLQHNMSYPSFLELRKNSLKSRFLIAFILTRSAMWAKTPYLYTFFMTVHKFSMAEIGILYLVEAVSSLIFGPITGQLADKYGRKKFCRFYNFIHSSSHTSKTASLLTHFWGAITLPLCSFRKAAHHENELFAIIKSLQCLIRCISQHEFLPTFSVTNTAS